MQDAGIIDATIHETGLVALTGVLNFLEVKGWEGGRPLVLASAGVLSRVVHDRVVLSLLIRSLPAPILLGRHSSRPND